MFDADGLEKSVNHLVEKRAHSEEILSTAAAHAARADEVAAGAAPFADWGEPLVPDRAAAPATA